MPDRQYDIAIIGGGIVGMATAKALKDSYDVSLIVLEAEGTLARHQTGNNSGVIHSGLYYKPGSLKAKNCVEGRESLYRFCQEHGVAHERCGKLVVAVTPEEIVALDRLEKRGIENGLNGIRRLDPVEMKENEPHVAGMAGLLIPETGIIDYVQLVEIIAGHIRESGAEISLNSRVTGLRHFPSEMVLETTRGEFHCRNLINCSGLYSDRVAKLCGIDPGLQIIPFRGEYYILKPDRRFLVKNLIYPVPDPQFPFLGVHFTRMIHGEVEAGPNAVLAFKREGYHATDVSMTDLLEFATYKGFWRMAMKHWSMGLGEFYRSFSKQAFVAALQRLIPEITELDVERGGAGVRAQALEPNGFLVDDFRIRESERMIHVLNAPSPAATACLSIGKTIASLAQMNFSLNKV